jgi:hypothetical protein
VASWTGCGAEKPAVAPVSGKVLYHGKPLAFGTVFFHPDAGTQGRGTIQPDGTFTITTYKEDDGAQIAKHKVRITCFESQDPMAGTMSFDEGNGDSLIPTKYNSLTTTDLTNVEVKAGPNTFKFVLKD